MGAAVRARAIVALGVVAAVAFAACGERETATQRISRIRRQFRIQPNGFQVRGAADGTPEVVVSVIAVNGGKETIDRLTLRVHVQGQEGRDRASVLAVVDTSALITGVSSQLTAVARGLDVGAGESVLIELEDEPAAGDLSGYAEYAGVEREPQGPGRDVS